MTEARVTERLGRKDEQELHGSRIKPNMGVIVIAIVIILQQQHTPIHRPLVGLSEMRSPIPMCASAECYDRKTSSSISPIDTCNIFSQYCFRYDT